MTWLGPLYARVARPVQAAGTAGCADSYYRDLQDSRRARVAFVQSLEIKKKTGHLRISEAGRAGRAGMGNGTGPVPEFGEWIRKNYEISFLD